MDTGIYANLFKVDFDTDVAEIAVIERAKYPDLRSLRSFLKTCSIYAFDDKIFGYGDNFDELINNGFQKEKISISGNPKFATRIILESISKLLTEKNFEVSFFKFSNEALDRNNPIILSIPIVKLYPVYEFKTIFLSDPNTDKIVFGIVIDTRFCQTLNEERASHNKIRVEIGKKHSIDQARKIMQEIKIKNDDLTPLGKKNTESSRNKMQKISKFINAIEDKIPTQLGISINIDKSFTRVVLEGEDG